MLGWFANYKLAISVFLSVVFFTAIVSAFTYTYNLGAEHMQNKMLAEQAKVIQLANTQRLKLEDKLQEANNAAALAYEKGRKDAEETYAIVIDDLRDRRIRMRDRWNRCATLRETENILSSAEFDAAARDREESAARIVRAAAQCDAQVRGLQNLIISTNEVQNDG